MDLRSHYPYWLIKNGLLTAFSSLQEHIKVDVAIIGAGISGALIAHYLCGHDISVAVLDRRHAGMGSTAASTALLQYEIDTPLRKLCGKIGEENAVKSYKLCLDAIYKLKDICAELSPELAFRIIPSLQYASYKKDVEDLQTELELRKRHGFKVKWLEPADIKEDFGFNAPGAILSAEGGTIDAYLMVHKILQNCADKGHSISSNTTVTNMEYKPRHVVLHTDTGYTVNAKKVVMACGYESLKYIPRQVAQLQSTYALVSEPVPKQDIWYKRSLIWETKEPYTYMRVTDDNRIIMGGLDDDFSDPHLRDSQIKRKAALLTESFNKKFANISIRPDFYWAGVFASTKDGLPYIGSIRERPHTYFALGFGGNGITFSLIAAEILKDTIMGKENADTAIFSFNR